MTTEAWIVSAGRVLASAHIATNRAERRRGLLGRDAFEGALVLPHCRCVHTIGMRFSLDVGFLDDDGRVTKITSMPRHRFGLPVRHATTVLEAQQGAFARWGVRVGDVLDIRTSNNDGQGHDSEHRDHS